MGYDPDAEDAIQNQKSVVPIEKTQIASPTPLSPARASFGATKPKERSNSEVERLGMGVGRLGFGQVGGAKAAAAPKKIGFGSTGSSRAGGDGLYI